MNIIDRLKGLIWPVGEIEPPQEGQLIYVYLPQALEPDERVVRYEAPLDAELRLSGLGWVSGGGTLQSAERADGSREILHVGVDVDALDVDYVRELLRSHLPELGCPPGTILQYEERGRALQDEYDGEAWALARPQQISD